MYMDFVVRRSAGWRPMDDDAAPCMAAYSHWQHRPAAGTLCEQSVLPLTTAAPVLAVVRSHGFSAEKPGTLRDVADDT